MTATVRAKAAKKAAIARPEPPAPRARFEPVRLETGDVPEERVTLFYVDDVPYSVDVRPGVNVGLRYLKIAGTSGEAPAMAFLLERLLGPEGYQALMDFDALTKEQFEDICTIAATLTLGALELPKA